MLNTTPVTPDEALSCLEALYPLRLEGQMTAMLHGSPGVGKSTTVAALAQSIGGTLIDRRLAHMNPEDLIGIPDRDHAAGVTRWLTPDFLPRDGKGVLFLDEFTCAHPDVQNAALELLLDRRLGNYRLPDDWFICAAGNGNQHGAAVHDLTTAASDRLCHFELVADPVAWCNWGMNNGVPAEVIAHIKLHPEDLDGIEQRVRQDHVIGPSPRNWFRLGVVLKNHPRPSTIRSRIFSGLVGLSAATTFETTLENLAQMPPIEKIMAARSEERMKLMPTTLGGVYLLAFALPGQISDVASARKAMSVAMDIARIEPDGDLIPLVEIQRLAFENIAQRIPKLHISREINKTPEWVAYNRMWEEITGQAAA